jgi:hypothetical protein
MAGFLYRVERDGTGLKKAVEAPVLTVGEVWQKGRRQTVWAPLPKTGVPSWQAVSLDGKPPIPVPGPLYFGSSPAGDLLSVGFSMDRTYVIPAEALSRLPAERPASEAEVAGLSGVRRIDSGPAVCGPSADVYAFYRGTVQRNLYRIPIP